MTKRIYASEASTEDQALTLRPQRINEFIGQEGLKENMKVFIQAAQERKESLDHALLSGPPGLGKTTFSAIIAREMRANLRTTSAPAIERSGDMAALLNGLQENDILFIDEIHRLRPVIEEVLYPAMEDFHLDINLGLKGNTKSVRVSLPRFTLIGATTRPGALTQPLLSRFGIVSRFEFYNQADMADITRRNVGMLQLSMNDEGLNEIAKRSRGTPRILNRLLRRIRDFAQVKQAKIITKDIIDYALAKMNIDGEGLDDMDRRILRTIIEHFDGGPVGVENLATSVSEDSATIEDIYEPYLIQLGLIKRTRQGRMATTRAYTYLGLPVPSLPGPSRKMPIDPKREPSFLD